MTTKSKSYRPNSHGVGAAAVAKPPAVQAAMHVPCAREHPAAALVSQAHYPTGPVAPATKPEELIHTT